ncbi:four helix bundle protein [candidate division WOR-3 bacterium]|nr:four helix bundle protein [candidate division WOR-3 bacterium]
MTNENKDKRRRGEDIEGPLLDFAIRIIKLVNSLPKTVVGKHVGGQLTRAGTSAGSNYGEACGAESKADFVHKLGVVLKELKESRFWLNLIHRTELIKPQWVKPLLQECEELCAIIAKSIITAKGK